MRTVSGKNGRVDYNVPIPQLIMERKLGFALIRIVKRRGVSAARNRVVLTVFSINRQ